MKEVRAINVKTGKYITIREDILKEKHIVDDGWVLDEPSKDVQYTEFQEVKQPEKPAEPEPEKPLIEPVNESKFLPSGVGRSPGRPKNNSNK